MSFPMTVKNAKLKPLYDRLVIEKIVESEVTKSGLIIPNFSKGDAYYGRVLAVGKGFRKADGSMHSLAYKPGDCVLYGKDCGTSFMVDGVEQILLHDDDVLAVYSGELNVGR